MEIDPQGNGWSQNPNGTWTNEGSVSRIYSILGKYPLCSEPRLSRSDAAPAAKGRRHDVRRILLFIMLLEGLLCIF